jgi:hypothetical protein
MSENQEFDTRQIEAVTAEIIPAKVFPANEAAIRVCKEVSSRKFTVEDAEALDNDALHYEFFRTVSAVGADLQKFDVVIYVVNQRLREGQEVGGCTQLNGEDGYIAKYIVPLTKAATLSAATRRVYRSLQRIAEKLGSGKLTGDAGRPRKTESEKSREFDEKLVKAREEIREEVYADAVEEGRKAAKADLQADIDSLAEDRKKLKSDMQTLENLRSTVNIDRLTQLNNTREAKLEVNKQAAKAQDLADEICKSLVAAVSLEDFKKLHGKLRNKAKAYMKLRNISVSEAEASQAAAAD